MIVDEGHKVSMDQILEFSKESFGWLLVVLEPQVMQIYFMQTAFY